MKEEPPWMELCSYFKKTPRELPQPFLHVRTQWRHSSPPRTELHQSLTILTPSSQISGLQKCRKYISIAEAPILLFCYGSPSIPRWHPSVPGFSQRASYVQGECQDECVQGRVRPRCGGCHSFTPFHGWVIFHCVDGPHYVYLFSMHLWMVIWVILSFSCHELCCYERSCTSISMDMFSFLGFICGSGSTESCDVSMFDILRSCQTDFQYGGIISHSH